MPRKLVENLDVGMVISQDLHDSNGCLLLPAGTILNAQHLRILRHWRVTVVYVDESGSSMLEWFEVGLEDLTDTMHIRNEKRIQDLFLYCGRDKHFVSQLFYYLLDRGDRISILESRQP